MLMVVVWSSPQEFKLGRLKQVPFLSLLRALDIRCDMLYAS